MPPPLENKNVIDVAQTYNITKGVSTISRRNGLQSGNKRPGDRKKCRGWCKKFSAMLFSHAGLCALVVGYSVAGAFAFGALEGPREEKGAQRVRLLRKATVQRLWELTENFNVLYPDNWTERVEQEIRRFQQELVKALREGAAYDVNAGGTAFTDEQDLHHYQKRRQWSFSGAFLYSLTVITTVGYGNIAPKTNWGKFVTVVYAIFGIPLMFLYLTNVGNLLAKAFKCIYGRICHASGSRRTRSHHQVANSRNRQQRQMEQYQIHHIMLQDATSPAGALANNTQNSIDSSTLIRNKLNASSDLMKGGANDDDDDDDDPLDDSDVMNPVSGQGHRRIRGRVTVPVTLCLIIVGAYICGGAALFSAWEGWDYLDGAYFCFVTLSTIGFGDLVPGDSFTSTVEDEEVNQEKLVMCSLYLLTGMALIAMCFNLVQEEVVFKLRGVGRSIGLISNSRDADD